MSPSRSSQIRTTRARCVAGPKTARAQQRVRKGRRGRYQPLREPATPAEADPVLVTWQKRTAIALIVAGLLSLAIMPLATAIVVNAIFAAFFAAGSVFKLMLIKRSLDKPCAIALSDDEIEATRGSVPVYTILVPVYHEANIVHQLIEGIAALDYPATKLDVKVLVEIDDDETADALSAVDLPSYVEVLTVPDVGPRGKPRACNHGLTRARGKYLVIYDAEDRPEADQLRKAVAAFKKVDTNVVCLQAHLNYFNRTQNILTRWFAAEYSMWFDQLLTSLQWYDFAIPLGGTSNHFITKRLRDLGGWNAYNVTEDADLGMRIHRRGWKTAIVNSTTYEEATSRTNNWVRQRSRWAKGYMQTYLCHFRQPARLYRELGPRAYVAFHLLFGAQTLGLLINPFYWLITILWFTTHAHVIQLSFPAAIGDVGLAGFFIGNAAFVLSTMIGCLGRRNYDDVKWTLLVPAYWLLMSIAAWKGLLQLFFKPYYWEKTIHGFSMFHDVEAKSEALSLPDLQPVEVAG